jgi:hypothetical protein
MSLLRPKVQRLDQGLGEVVKRYRTKPGRLLIGDVVIYRKWSNHLVNLLGFTANYLGYNYREIDKWNVR